MAWTQSDLDALEKALVSGVLSVTLPSGVTTRYRDTADLIRARDMVRASLNANSTTQLKPRYQQAVFSD